MLARTSSSRRRRLDGNDDDDQTDSGDTQACDITDCTDKALSTYGCTGTQSNSISACDNGNATSTDCELFVAKDAAVGFYQVSTRARLHRTLRRPKDSSDKR